MSNPYKAYFAIEAEVKQQGFDFTRAEIIQQYTAGEKDSLKALTDVEYQNFLNWIQSEFRIGNSSNWKNSPENKKRQKLWCIFVKEMNYTKAEFDHWILHYGKFKQPLQQLSSEQLSITIVQAEKVLESFTKATYQRTKS